MKIPVLRWLQTAVDLTILLLAYFSAFLLRFDGNLPVQMWKRFAFTAAYVVGVQYVVLVLFSVPRFAWRYVGVREAVRIGVSTGVAAAVLLAVRVVAGFAQIRWSFAQYAFVPAGVSLANLGTAFVGVAGVRLLWRMLVDRGKVQSLRGRSRKLAPTIIIGAGEAGVMVAREVASRPDLGLEIVGFLDDDRSKKRQVIRGIPVLGGIDAIEQMIEAHNVERAIIAVADPPASLLRRVVEGCERTQVNLKIIPGLYELLDGKINLSRLRDVTIEDLLGRESVVLETGLLGEFLGGKVVLVTGAGGSIGTELCRQVARFGPAELVLVERAEFALFTIHEELRRTFPRIRLSPEICDVGDRQRVEEVFAHHAPAVVFHAAAHKHVPMMEWNAGEAVKNNIFGTKTLADVAKQYGVGAFVMISTDKAVNPTSIMGATKRVAEMYVQALSAGSKTKFVAVRFGNVLGSTGSVIPTFQGQIARGGPVTVTHPEMRRYFMTIPEASQLVMQAGAMGKGGEIFVLDMGTPVKITDLAEQLIRLNGLEPGVDMEITFTGLRPGEKLFEELGFDSERMEKTRHEKIWVGRLTPCAVAELAPHLEKLAQVVGKSREDLRRTLSEVVPELVPEQNT